MKFAAKAISDGCLLLLFPFLSVVFLRNLDYSYI